MPELGKRLREARLRQGLELTHVEAQIRVRTKYLRALEWERFDLLPDEEAARRAVRAYAEHLELDPRPYLHELDARLGVPERPAVRLARGRRGFSRRDLAASLVPLAPSTAAVVTVLLLAGGSPSDRANARPAPPPPPPTPVQKPSPPERERVPPSPPETGPAVAPKLVRLVVSAPRGDSWVQVRSGSERGPVLFEGTLSRGRSLRFEKRRLWIRLGAASNLEVRANGARPDVSLYGTFDALVTPDGLRKVPPAG